MKLGRKKIPSSQQLVKVYQNAITKLIASIDETKYKNEKRLEDLRLKKDVNDDEVYEAYKITGVIGSCEKFKSLIENLIW